MKDAVAAETAVSGLPEKLPNRPLKTHEADELMDAFRWSVNRHVYTSAEGVDYVPEMWCFVATEDRESATDDPHGDAVRLWMTDDMTEWNAEITDTEIKESVWMKSVRMSMDMMGQDVSMTGVRIEKDDGTVIDRKLADDSTTEQ